MSISLLRSLKKTWTKRRKDNWTKSAHKFLSQCFKIKSTTKSLCRVPLWSKPIEGYWNSILHTGYRGCICLMLKEDHQPQQHEWQQRPSDADLGLSHSRGCGCHNSYQNCRRRQVLERMRGLRSAPQNPADPERLHCPALRCQTREPHLLSPRILPEAGAGDLVGIQDCPLVTWRCWRGWISNATTYSAGAYPQFSTGIWT